MAIYVGQSPIAKGRHGGLGFQQSIIVNSDTQTGVDEESGDYPFIDQGPIKEPDVEASITQSPIDVVDTKRVLTHRHFGHADTHPVSLRHRKSSADPDHKEEDKLVDEYKGLFDKAKRGQCNPIELGRMRDIRGRMQEIDSGRAADARRVLGDQIDQGDMLGQGFSLRPQRIQVPRPGQKPGGVAPTYKPHDPNLVGAAAGRSGKTFKSRRMRKGDYAMDGMDDHEDYDDGREQDRGVDDDELDNTILWDSLDRVVDAAIMASAEVMKAHHDEPHYPADEAEDDGTHGSMTEPTEGAVANDTKPSKNIGPYPYTTFGEVVSNAERPKGWDKKSSKKYWKSISKKGPHTECVNHVGGNVDDPHAFCAWAEHEGSGHWPGERKTEEKQMMPSSSASTMTSTSPASMSMMKSQATSVAQFKSGLSTNQHSI